MLKATHPKAGTKMTVRIKNRLSPAANSDTSFAACACQDTQDVGKENEVTQTYIS